MTGPINNNTGPINNNKGLFPGIGGSPFNPEYSNTFSSKRPSPMGFNNSGLFNGKVNSGGSNSSTPSPSENSNFLGSMMGWMPRTQTNEKLKQRTIGVSPAGQEFSNPFSSARPSPTGPTNSLFSAKIVNPKDLSE